MGLYFQPRCLQEQGQRSVMSLAPRAAPPPLADKSWPPPRPPTPTPLKLGEVGAHRSSGGISSALWACWAPWNWPALAAAADGGSAGPASPGGARGASREAARASELRGSSPPAAASLNSRSEPREEKPEAARACLRPAVRRAGQEVRCRVVHGAAGLVSAARLECGG